jgi:NADH:ubiquinone oxidoreductase subunit 5 (subunit L)/multisubunit Na+/H+ antiporter MnhA subunit
LKANPLILSEKVVATLQACASGTEWALKDTVENLSFWLLWLAIFTGVLLGVVGFWWGLYSFFRPPRPNRVRYSLPPTKRFLHAVEIAILSTVLGMAASSLPLFHEASSFDYICWVGWSLTEKVRDLSGTKNFLILLGLPVVINSTIYFCVLWWLYLIWSRSKNARDASKGGSSS